ncbi:transmembrane protein, putative (macronuclear) [Tetrahymena thermophila SB210]|uniref:Transmembrane protein, putative n=1 Tax=Tetrahymena thermophila (strain SB210) TaxID=312017 RepID=A4VEB0_TETTS|nr:transmembrane protein, putative [Tetrahymena thermophila SB210]EDK31866.1 transmembrane protein, putative [Tetrahymena thermophila SB210]|eukprot:XP_001471247.1 transmembrane protein, putative [Tetrahymena thermophila SB210]
MVAIGYFFFAIVIIFIFAKQIELILKILLKWYKMKENFAENIQKQRNYFNFTKDNLNKIKYVDIILTKVFLFKLIRVCMYHYQNFMILYSNIVYFMIKGLCFGFISNFFIAEQKSDCLIIVSLFVSLFACLFVFLEQCFNTFIFFCFLFALLISLTKYSVCLVNRQICQEIKQTEIYLLVQLEELF